MSQPAKQNLYRKYRPRAFAELLGQEHVTRTLQTAAATNRISHAYLFSGPRGTGKTTAARLLAKILNCLEPITPSRGLLDACTTCDVCLRIDQQTFMDIVEIDGASNTSVDNIRDLREKVKYQPAEGKCKVYIIDEVHMLSTAAFNAFLKTLEEPPPNMVFILATTDPQKVPATILSRCQCFDFHPISQRILLDRLVELVALEHEADPARFPVIGREALALVAECAQGGFRDALSLLDQISSTAGGQEINLDQVLHLTRRLGFAVLRDLSTAIFGKNTAEMIRLLNDLFARGHDVSIIGRDLLEHFRRCLLLKVDPDINRVLEIPQEQVSGLLAQIGDLPLEFLLAASSHLERALVNLRNSVDPRILLEMELVRLTIREVSLGLEGLERRISQIENSLASGPRIVSPSSPGPGRVRAGTSSGGAAPRAGGMASSAGLIAHGDSPVPDGQNKASGTGLLEKFQEFRSRVSAKNPVLGGILQSATISSYREGILTLTLENGFSVRRTQEPKNVELFRRHLDEIFGTGTTLIAKCVTSGDEPSASASASVPSSGAVFGSKSPSPDQSSSKPPRAVKKDHAEEIARIDQQTRAKVLEKPAIKDAISVFGGEIVSLNRP